MFIPFILHRKDQTTVRMRVVVAAFFLNDEDENKLGLLDDENDEPGLSDDEDEFEQGLSDHKEENEAGLMNYMQNKKVRTAVCLESLAPTQSIVAFGEIYNKCPNTRGGRRRPSQRMWYISYLA